MFHALSQVLIHMFGMWRFRWYALGLAFVACLAGWTVVSLLPDEYVSSARVSIDTSSALEPLLKGIVTETDPTEKVTMIIRTMLSRPNLEKIARATDLDLRAGTPEEMEELLRDLHKRIRIDEPFASKFMRTKETVVYYDISFVDRDAATAQKVVQVIVDSLVEGTLGGSRGDTDAAQRFLLEQIGGYEAQLKVAEAQLAEFKKKNTAFMSGLDGSFSGRLQALTEELYTAQAEYDAAVNRRNVLRQQLQGEIPLTTDQDSVLNPLDSAIAEYQIKLDELLLRYTEAHPDVQQLRETIQQLEQRKAQEHEVGEMVNRDPGQESKPASEHTAAYKAVKVALQQAEVEVASLEAKLAEMRTRVGRLRETVAAIPDIEMQYANLNRGYEVVKKQYLALLSRLESAKLSEDLRTSNFDVKFQIIEPPIVPLSPTEPNRLLFHSAVLAVGLGSGAGFAFLLNMLFTVFLTPSELRVFDGFPVLGRVSAIPTRAQIRMQRFGYMAFAAVFGSLLSLYANVILHPERGVELAQELKEQTKVWLS